MPQTKTKPAAPKASRKPKAATIQPISAPEPIEAPDWANVTPDDNDYKLIMFTSDGAGEQEIAVTRKEFNRNSSAQPEQYQNSITIAAQ